MERVEVELKAPELPSKAKKTYVVSMFMSRTVSSSQGDFVIRENLVRRKQLQRALINRCILIHPTTHPHDPCDSRRKATSYETHQPTCAEPFPKNAISGRNQLLLAYRSSPILFRPRIRSRGSISALHSNDKQRNAVADTYKALPQT